MNELVNKVSEILLSEGDKKNADVLRNIKGELTDVNEAFELGRALQSLYERTTETSNTGVDEDEIGEVIQFVQDNIQQARY